jgi:DNA-binding transcriptional LysR family regulator
LKCSSDDHSTDLVTERSDAGFRGGPPPSDGSIARRLAPIPDHLCVARNIERNGAPRPIEELGRHCCTGISARKHGQA